jgi:hypothetical protein
MAAQRAFLRVRVVASVWKDWMVETEGTKLPTPLAVMSNQSPATVPETEILDAEATRRNRLTRRNSAAGNRTGSPRGKIAQVYALASASIDWKAGALSAARAGSLLYLVLRGVYA